MSSPIDRRTAFRIAACALVFRLFSAVLAMLVNIAFPLDAPLQMTVFATPSTFWDAFARYDSGWYEGIARNGYAYAEGGRSNIAYFPVYPMLMRYVGRLLGRYHAAFYLGGIIVSWTSFVLAMVALYYLARLDLPRRRAVRAVLLTAIFPFAFFFGVVYSESTFLLFTVLAFYLFRTRRWITGGSAAALAIATRVTGVLMWPGLALIAWTHAGPAGEERRDRALAAVALVLSVAGFAWYCAFVYAESGNPFEWAATLQRWNYEVGRAPWTAPARLVGHLATHPYAYLAGERMALYETLYGITGILFLAAVPFVWMRFGAGYGLFMLLNLLLPLSSGVFEGVGRYCSVLFPCFIWLASLRSRALGTAIVVVFAMFYVLGLALFTTVHPLF
ncbi:MAG TPA: mannosyltransferase family protein [Vicinamibacterales bacterium]|nr:mannosyltransferase family protein [Vicinamibacterales bacterium]